MVCGIDFAGASSDCASFPCRNGGSCYSRDGDVTCACRSGFTGPRCETGKNTLSVYWFTGPRCETGKNTHFVFNGSLDRAVKPVRTHLVFNGSLDSAVKPVRTHT